MARVYYSDGYDIAQICLHGHVINDSTRRQPEHSWPRCSRCGAETITACLHCGDIIAGMYYFSGVATRRYERSAHCSSCGKPYPWTEANLTALKEFAEEQFADEDRNRLADIIENLSHETPRTDLAVERMKKLSEKAGPAASEAFNKIAVGVISETVFKLLRGK